MGILLDTLKEKKLLVSDGAWGTMLQAQGLEPSDCPEEWNISHPNVVKSIANKYAEAGSDMVLTNTFGGSRKKLEKCGLGDRVKELNLVGAKLSKEGAPDCIVAGSVGPTGEFLEPYGEMTEKEMIEVFAEQIEALVEGGIDVVCIETMSAIEEAICAIKAARIVKQDIEIIATMTFDPTPKGFRTMMGVDCKRAAEALTEAGADVVGSNCGNGIEQMIPITEEMRKYTDRPILIHANAGVPELINGKTVFRETPEQMARFIEPLVKAGASIIGGCCGTTPEHIKAIKAEIDKLLTKM